MSRIYKKIIYKLITLLIVLSASCGLTYAAVALVSSRIPGSISMHENEYKTIEFNLPMTGNIEISSPADTMSVQAVNFGEPVSFIADKAGEYSLNVKLLGIFNVKTMTVNVISTSSLIPCGFPVGIYLKTDGVLVVDTTQFTDDRGNLVSPCSGQLKSGDYITSLNGNTINTKAEFIRAVDECGGEPVNIGIRRDGTASELQVIPHRDAAGEWKIGVWVRDDSQGIGTLTYISSDGKFGALGHGISDTDIGTILEIKTGILYNARILSISKGQSGKPGEYVGSINYNSSNRIGTIVKNQRNGIYGIMDNVNAMSQSYQLKELEIGFKEDVKKGEAAIQTCVSGEIKQYSIKITGVDISNQDNKNITFVVTDSELLDITNGIVQGMSGSPIIQNNRIIGAVTHVFVDDSTSGYGIFIENMLE